MFMKILKEFSEVIAVLILIPLAGCGGSGASPTATPVQTEATKLHCAPTFGDALSPSYKPDASLRSIVGHGHVLTGVVRSSEGCAPIANVKLELWSEEAGRGHPDAYRATLFTDNAGVYRFECNPTDHIHMRISAEGYQGIASNAYHTEGKPTGTFDIVLQPEKP